MYLRVRSPGFLTSITSGEFESAAESAGEREPAGGGTRFGFAKARRSGGASPAPTEGSVSSVDGFDRAIASNAYWGLKDSVVVTRSGRGSRLRSPSFK